MKIAIQMFALAIILVVFSSTGLFFWNLAAIKSQERLYSKGMMSQKATEQFAEDIENGFVRIISLVNNPNLYGSLIYPGVPPNCVENLRERGLETFVNTLLYVEQAYWGERYHLLYPGPYLYFAEEYNTKAVNYWLSEGDDCLLSHFGMRQILSNNLLNPLRPSLST